MKETNLKKKENDQKDTGDLRKDNNLNENEKKML